jgi:hypothetical protein
MEFGIEIPHSREYDLRVDMGRTEDHSSHHIITLTTLLVSIAFLRHTTLSIRLHHPVHSGLTLETRESKTWDTSYSLFLGAKSFSDNLTLGGGVEGSASGAGE